MKLFIAITIFCSVAFAAEDYCYKDVVQACKSTTKKCTCTLNCTAVYGAIEAVQPSLQKFTNHHFIRSFEYLLLATNFANYERNRPGFEKLFRSLSDNKWEKSIELIKYLTKRGGHMNFGLVSEDLSQENELERSFELNEFVAVAKALDFEKKLARETEEIHREATRKNKNLHDPEISDYLEEEFTHKQRDIIRKLAGYATDLSEILDGPDSSLSLFLFDEYLQN